MVEISWLMVAAVDVDVELVQFNRGRWNDSLLPFEFSSQVTILLNLVSLPQLWKVVGSCISASRSFRDGPTMTLQTAENFSDRPYSCCSPGI